MSENTRRTFIKTASAFGVPALLKGASVTNAIKVGIVGCGGRGTGATAQAIKADDGAELVSMADITVERIDESLASLEKFLKPEVRTRLKVEQAKKFAGLDGYEKLVNSGVDVVLLATPPGFRPLHLRAAVEAKKHLFVEKPVSTDAPGVRHVLESVKMAKEKNLNLVAGFCWRYANHIVETFDKIQNGAIGNVVNYYGTYYTTPVKPMPPASDRPAGMSDMEWQVKNWYNFSWLCGDSLVEQAVHTVDKVAWAFNDQPPISCVGVGGRQIPAEGGNIYDHFEVNYLYPNNARATVANRQIVGCYNENADYIQGTKGTAIIGRGPNPRIEGETTWSYEGQKYDMYQREHDVLFASIRKGTVINNGERLATSTMLAIMGRMAAYTGQQITWEQAMNSQERLIPEKMDWNMKWEVPPTARPGITKFV